MLGFRSEVATKQSLARRKVLTWSKRHLRIECGATKISRAGKLWLFNPTGLVACGVGSEARQ